MSLSVLCPTRDPGPRVRALLEPLRAVADEIIIAADSNAPEEHLGHYAAVADRVVRFDRGQRHSALAWLHAQCRGDWILLLAGDEVVSTELLAALPELTARRDAQQVSFTLRWLWPDTGRWLSGAPWYPDFQTRLMRNDGTLRFRGLPHELALPVSPARFVDLPIWHLSLLASPVEARRRKVEANAREREGLTAAGGGELNAAFYLPEDATAPATSVVAAAERARIDAVLHATGAALPTPSLPIIGRDAIDPSWAQRDVLATAPSLRCELTLLDAAPLQMQRGAPRTAFVRVHNLGPEPWTWGLGSGGPPFRLGFGWEGDPPDARADLPCDVPAGDDTIVPIQIPPPAAATGRHRLHLDMVLEHVRWFGCPLVVEVDVVD